MVLSLRLLSIKAFLQDLLNQKHYINTLPRAILYNLVQYCFSAKPKKTLAFQILFKNWPFDTFCIQSIGITLDADDIVLILFAIRMGQFGSIKHFDLVQKEFSSIESQSAEQYIRLLLYSSRSLNTDPYGYDKEMSPSHGDFVKNAETLAKEERNNVSLLYHNGAKHTGAKRKKVVSLSDRHLEICAKKRKNTDDCCQNVIVIDADEEDIIGATKLKNEITIHFDFYADLRVKYLVIADILANEVYDNKNLLIKLIPVRIKFLKLPSKQIEYILNSIVNTDNIRCLDLSYTGKSWVHGGLSLITETLRKFTNLENVCIAYSGLSPTNCQLLVDCFKQLPKLKRLDLSCNSFGESLCEFFDSDSTSKCLTELILTNCKITKSVLDAMAGCKWLSNLKKLRLDHNKLTDHGKNALKNVLIKNKATLRYLDVSHCGLDDEYISKIRPIINDPDLLLFVYKYR